MTDVRIGPRRRLPLEPATTWERLPMRFHRLGDGRVVLTNLVGEHAIVAAGEFDGLMNGDAEPALVRRLRGKHLLRAPGETLPIDLLTMKAQTKLRWLPTGPALHIFVVSLRCEHTCRYCQVSRQTSDKGAFDMTVEHAARALDLVFASPSPALKIELQGGEPLLNFELVRWIVTEAERRNEGQQRDLAFVIATNLALLDDDVIDFCRAHHVHLSTSLDGPEDLHNANRPRPGRDSWQRAVAGIRRAQAELGPDRVSALMTTTEASLGRVTDIIDTYVTLGLPEIFLRPISPYGFAVRGGRRARYDAQRWLAFYEEGLDHILELRRDGVGIIERYAAIVARKMLTNDDPGYVDLRSPAGIGLGALVYNYDGDVYASDEGRMLAEMGDRTFRLGNVLTDDLAAVLGSDALLDPLEESYAGSAPMCSDCAFETWCGADPTYHHAVAGDFLGRKPSSAFCQRNMGVFELLVQKYEDDPFARRVLREWAHR